MSLNVANHQMVEYCESTMICRHKVLCEYFGDTIGDTTQKVDGINPFCDYACDICRDPEATKQLKLSKLTPVGSQNEFYPREEDIERPLEVFDTSLDHQATVAVQESDNEDEMKLDTNEEGMNVDIPRRVVGAPIINT